MPVSRLNELAKNPRQVQASLRTALINKLVTAASNRAAHIARIDGAVNAVYARFASDASFTRASIAKLASSLATARKTVNRERTAALRDLNTSIKAGLQNRKIVAQYEDLSALSAKIATLLVTARASQADDGNLTDHDLVNIDSNGYVADDNMSDSAPSTDTDLSVAAEGDEDQLLKDGPPASSTPMAAQAGRRSAEPNDPVNLRAGDPNDPDHSNNPSDGSASGATAARTAREVDELIRGNPNDPDTSNNPSDGEVQGDNSVATTLKPTVGRQAFMRMAKIVDPASTQTYPAEPQEIDSAEEAVKAARAALASAEATLKAAKSGKTAAPAVVNPQSTQTYPQDPQEVDSAEQALTAARAGAKGGRRADATDPESNPMITEAADDTNTDLDQGLGGDTADTPVQAGDDDNALGDDTPSFDDGLSAIDPDNQSDEGLGGDIEIADSGIDEALAAEILGDDGVADGDDGNTAEAADDDLPGVNDDQQVTARVQARGGKAAASARRLASAQRTNPRASDSDSQIRSMMSEMLM